MHPSSWPIDPAIADAFNAGGTGKGTYDPNVPVARPAGAGFDWGGNPSSVVTLGTDMVMCLSCHVAHGSQYPDMLRWDMEDMIVGTRPPEEEVGDGKGCFKCHTDKNKADYYEEGKDEERRCNYCHTMHDSQNGVSVAVDGPYAYLLNDPSLTNPHK
ncbi:MAG: hypothetical protein C5S40_00525 [ANME-2 cluster archaeon]|nr:hypothetical protein [ANME-2 cluster archaeon]